MKYRSLLVLMMTALASTAASATVISVLPDGTGEYPTIQAAIDAADPGDIISLGDGTFLGDGNRDISFDGKRVTVRGQSGNADSCLIDCEGSEIEPHRGFTVGVADSVQFDGFTIINGYDDQRGGALLIEGFAEVYNCRFNNNEAAFGGGVAIAEDAHADFANCEFNDNTVSDDGGAVVVFYGSTTIKDCAFEQNIATLSGGGVYFDHSYDQSTISRCEFLANEATTGIGGGVAVKLSDVEISTSTFISNTAVAGGGVSQESGTSLTINNSTLYGNTAEYGSGILTIQHEISINQTILSHGIVGEAVYCVEYPTGSATLSCCDVYGNEGGDWVGCIAEQEGINGNISLNPLFCDAESGDLTLHSDSPCAWANNPECGYIGALPVGCGDTSDTPNDVAGSTLMMSAAPNPFGNATTIQYALPSATTVDLQIYDVAGREVAVLARDEQQAGVHTIEWNTDTSAGIYFAKLRIDGEEITRTLVVTR